MQQTLKMKSTDTTPAKKMRKRVLFANVPADGHFNPLTGLAVYLQGIGYEVRWYSSSLYANRISKLQIPYYPFKRALEVTQENMEEVFPERKNHKSQVSKLNFDMINVFILRSTEYYADIAEIHETFPFDLMIADVAFSAIPLVKAKLNVPVISVGVFPLSETSKDLAPYGLGMLPSGTFLGRRKQNLLRFVADKILFRKSFRVMKTILDNNNIENAGSNIFDTTVRNSTLVLQSGTPGFEYKRSDLGSNIRFIGPLLPFDSKKKRNPWFDERLNRFEKIILVTQGTVEKDPKKILIPTLEAFKNTDYLVVATTGGSGTRELKERYPYNNIIIEDFIPFADIMPYANAYVTNGGYGGVMLAIQHQLPLVVAGVHEGKNEINARVGYFKLGINLGTENPIPRQLQGSVEEVLTNEVYRQNVQCLSEEFGRYNPEELCASYVAETLRSNPSGTARPASTKSELAYISQLRRITVSRDGKMSY